MSDLINNTKLLIKDEVLTNKYTLVLLADGSATGTYFLSIQRDLVGAGSVEVASVSYNNMLINGMDATKTIISSPEIYAELTADNCTDFTYNFITLGLR
jgi:hypothetical protein